MVRSRTCITLAYLQKALWIVPMSDPIHLVSPSIHDRGSTKKQINLFWAHIFRLESLKHEILVKISTCITVLRILHNLYVSASSSISNFYRFLTKFNKKNTQNSHRINETLLMGRQTTRKWEMSKILKVIIFQLFACIWMDFSRWSSLRRTEIEIEATNRKIEHLEPFNFSRCQAN